MSNVPRAAVLVKRNKERSIAMAEYLKLQREAAERRRILVKADVEGVQSVGNLNGSTLPSA